MQVAGTEKQEQDTKKRRDKRGDARGAAAAAAAAKPASTIPTEGGGESGQHRSQTSKTIFGTERRFYEPRFNLCE
jgi:hypothetical protein